MRGEQHMISRDLGHLTRGKPAGWIGGGETKAERLTQKTGGRGTNQSRPVGGKTGMDLFLQKHIPL